MRTTGIYFLILLLPFKALTQGNDVTLQQALTSFFEATATGDYERVLDGMYPDLFKVVPRDKMMQALSSLNEDSTIQFSFSAMEAGSVRKRIVHQGIQYVALKYTYLMTATVAPPDPDHPEDDMWSAMEVSMAIMAGDAPVESDPQARTLRARLPREMICILDPRYEGWKFIENKPGNDKLMARFLPSKVVKAIRIKR
ncbi:MAG: hypothetical protein SF053_05970 [Bacteroidia bacterium]|nr:hypothetical protein [Bacteroidia bacterium]